MLADAVPGERLRDILLVFAGAALTAIGAQISVPVPGSPVPVTAQTLAVVLAGSALGCRRGSASQLLYLVLGLFMPIYAGGSTGAGVLWSADGGYIFGFVVAAGLIGWAAEHGGDRRVPLATLAFALGQLAVFGIGVPWLKASTGISWGAAIAEGFTPFLLGGAIKAVIAGACMPTAWRIERRLRSSR